MSEFLTAPDRRRFSLTTIMIEIPVFSKVGTAFECHIAFPSVPLNGAAGVSVWSLKSPPHREIPTYPKQTGAERPKGPAPECYYAPTIPLSGPEAACGNISAVATFIEGSRLPRQN